MTRLYLTFLSILMLSAILLSGCAGNNTETPAESGSIPEAADDASTAEAPPPKRNQSAASITFEGTDMEGNTVSSDVVSQSKITMLNVWATFCGPCLREMPELGELAAEYSAEEFQLIGIISDVLEGNDQSLAESLVQQTGANYPHLLLNESIYYALLTDVSAVPTTFFLDSEGNILKQVKGAKDKAAWEEIINELLEAQ